jgi:hypothetical protein
VSHRGLRPACLARASRASQLRSASGLSGLLPALLQPLTRCASDAPRRRQVLCDELALSLRTNGLVIPPWRESVAMLSKWPSRPGAFRLVVPNGSAATSSHVGPTGGSLGAAMGQAVGSAAAALPGVGGPAGPQLWPTSGPDEQAMPPPSAAAMGAAAARAQQQQREEAAAAHCMAASSASSYDHLQVRAGLAVWLVGLLG